MEHSTMEAIPFKLAVLRVVLASAALLLLLVGSFLILRPFVVGLAWATILAVILSPLYRRLCTAFPNAEGRNAFVVVAAVGFLICASFTPFVLALRSDTDVLTDRLTEYLSHEHLKTPEFVRRLPLGNYLAENIDRLTTDRDALISLVKRSQGTVVDTLAAALSRIAETVVTILLALCFCFFLLRSKLAVSGQVSLALRSIAGDRSTELLTAVSETVRGAVYGVVATATAQGILAGIGYLVSGAPIPFMLGLITIVFSLIPFGTPIVYVPVSIYLIATGSTVAGIGLLLWGVLVVSLIDNLLRPIFLSQATQMPVILSFVGVVGGVLQFGLLGIVLGPTILAVALALWREYLRSLPVSDEPALA